MSDEKITRRLNVLEAQEAQTGDVRRQVLHLYMRRVRTILNQETGERREEVIEVPSEGWVLSHEFDAEDCSGRPAHWKVWKPRPESDHGVLADGEVTR
jgi:hypothetical protein